MSEESFLLPRKERRVSASVCLICKNVASCGRALLLFLGSPSATSCLPFPPSSSAPLSLRISPFQPSFFGFCSSPSHCRLCPLVFYSSLMFHRRFEMSEMSASLVCSHPRVCSYEGVLASYRPTTAEPVPFSCLGDEHPAVGPLYGEELLLVEVGRCGIDRGSGGSDATGGGSRSGGRSTAEGGNGNARGNPVI